MTAGKILLLTSLLLSGCSGFFFKPGIALDDPAIFAEPPVIVKRGDNYFLQWRYGTDGFYFFPEYKARDGVLWFSLQATSSTGNRDGRTGEVPIEGRAAIEALKAGGAIWWSRDGRKTALTIQERSS